MWSDVAKALQHVEAALGLSYEPAITTKQKPQDGAPSTANNKRMESFIFFEDSFESAMVVHTLMMSVVYFTHICNHAEASPRLSHLHALLDSGALDKFPEGIVEVCYYIFSFHMRRLTKRVCVGATSVGSTVNDASDTPPRAVSTSFPRQQCCEA